MRGPTRAHTPTGSFAAGLLTPPVTTRKRTGTSTAGPAEGIGSRQSRGTSLGPISGYICRTCGTRVRAREGGGFFFDLLHCDECGRTNSVRHQDKGEIHLRFVKGLPSPYAVARATMDRHIQRMYRGEPLSREGYHTAVEDTLEACPCGGRFRYGAPARCPNCRSTKEHWDVDPMASRAFYD